MEVVRPRGLPLPACAATFAVGLSLASCSSPLQPNSRLSFDEVDSVQTSLACDRIDNFQDDVYFYDSMRGFDCVTADESALLLRVYEHDTSTQQVLPDWTPTLSKSNQLLVGTNWFAVGEPKLLDQLTSLIGLPVPRVSEYEAKPTDMSEAQRAIGACSAFITADVRTVLTNGDPSYSDAERVYPGVTEQIVTAAEALRSEGSSPATFESAISTLGPILKKYCTDWETQHARQ